MEEKALFDWDSKISKKYVSKSLAQEIHDKAAPFLTWLKEAEEEESESEEDDDDDLEVRLLNLLFITILKIFKYLSSFFLRLSTTIELSRLWNRLNNLLRLKIKWPMMIREKEMTLILMPFKKKETTSWKFFKLKYYSCKIISLLHLSIYNLYSRKKSKGTMNHDFYAYNYPIFRVIAKFFQWQIKSEKRQFGKMLLCSRCSMILKFFYKKKHTISIHFILDYK